MTSLSVRIGVSAVLIVFYIDAFLRGGAWYSWAFFGALVIPAAIGLIVTTRHVPRGLRPRVDDVALAAASTLIVAIGVREWGVSAVLMASAMGVVAALLSLVHGRLAMAAAPIYCGAFAGMTSALVLADWLSVAVSGLLAGLFVSVLRASWEGIGGKLGLLAFGGVFIVVAGARLLGTMGAGAPLLDLSPADRIAIILTPVVAATVTWALRHRGVSPVLASASLTAVFTLVMLSFDHVVFDATPLCIAWFGGSFIGMTAPDRIGGRLWPLLVAAVLFGVLQIGFKPTVAGFGGDFGATAAIAVLATIGLVEIARARRPGS